MQTPLVCVLGLVVTAVLVAAPAVADGDANGPPTPNVGLEIESEEVTKRSLPRQPAVVHREQPFPHVVMSFGIASMSRGPGARTEQTLRALHFDRTMGPQQTPWTQPLFGAFVHADVAIRKRIMIGAFRGTAANATAGNGSDTQLHAEHRVVTRALVMSFQATPRASLGVGPAWHSRQFLVGSMTSSDTIIHSAGMGWVANGDLKVRSGPWPGMVDIVVQYRHAGTLAVPAIAVPLDMPNNRLAWPATSIPYSHWLVGVGFGVEF